MCMAILAVYPHAKNLQVAVWDGSLFEKTIVPLPSSGDDTAEKHLIPWLTSHNITTDDLQCIVTGDNAREAAKLLGTDLSLEVFFIESATSAECPSIARVTGTPEIERRCDVDAFMFAFLARLEAASKEVDLAEEQFVVAHLDEEIQIAALRGTRVLDALTSFDEGPFALRQSGALPFDSVLDLCMRAASKEEVLAMLHNEGGLAGYLGIKSLDELWTLQGETAERVRETLVYQIAKEIGAMAVTLNGDVRSIVLAGDMVRHEPFVQSLKERVGFVAPISVYPGNQTLPALVAGAQDILDQQSA